MLVATPLVLTLLVALAAAAGAPSAAKAALRGTARSHTTAPFEQLDNGSAAGYTAQNVKGRTWTGATYHDFPNGTFTRVTGTIVAPTVRPPPGGKNDTAYYISAWVGIDGWSNCTNAIFQTGIDVVVGSDDPTPYRAWYEWYPERTRLFTSYSSACTGTAQCRSLTPHAAINIQPGDTLRFTVEATSLNTGTARIENLSNGGTLFQNVSSDVALCAADAEWIVEDFRVGGKTLPFADFGSVTFGDANATVAPGGGVIGPQYATLIDMYQNDRKLTEASSGLWNVTINYVG